MNQLENKLSFNPKRRKHSIFFFLNETNIVTSILPDFHFGFCQLNQSAEILYKTVKDVNQWVLVAKPVAWFVSKFGTVGFAQFQTKNW